MSSLRRANASVQPCHRGHKGGFNAGETLAYQNVMDHRWLGTVWHLQTWCAEHARDIKRVSLVGHTEQLNQENLIPLRMHIRPARPRAVNGTSHISHRSLCRECVPRSVCQTTSRSIVPSLTASDCPMRSGRKLLRRQCASD